MPVPPRTGPAVEDDQRWPALLIATLSSFLTPFMLSAVNIALPAIGRQFGADAVLLSWVATAYLLAASVSLMPFGRLSDLHGRKRVFLVGMTVFTASSVLCGLAGSVEALILFRVFQGFGIAMVFATGIAILTSVTPPDERGRALGITG
jgi:MFS family permease